MNDANRNIGQRLIHRWHWLLEGDAESPEQCMNRSFLFCAALGCFAGGLLNYLGGLTDMFYIVLVAIIGSALLAIWAYLRRGHYMRHSTMVGACLVIIGLIPLNWIYNQGLDGPSLLLFMLVAGYAFGVLLVPPWQRLLIAALFLVVPYGLIWSHYRWPDWIDPYPSPAAHAMDAAMTYTICIVLLLVMVSGFFRRFESEQRLINDYAERLREAGLRDSLTGLFNHGSFYALVDGYCRQENTTQPVRGALILYDLDYFKNVNDSYGHVYGDTTLKFFARVLREIVDVRGGTAGRCGGEEFAVFLPEAGPSEVEEVDTLLRAACEAQPLEHGPVRFSGGVAFQPARTIESWMERADNALYAAKCRGRNATVYRTRAE
ncbi:GGDEF domain-containing protein [Salinisphaera sp. S4-8]|uniref:GGDEF domain-containing protein n=1 Tax=Salinisphaera sp. S4-8 TaxID=633357 RepID=UPI0033403A0A